MQFLVLGTILVDLDLQGLLFELVVFDNRLLQLLLQLGYFPVVGVLIALVDAPEVPFQGLLILLDAVHPLLQLRVALLNG